MDLLKPSLLAIVALASGCSSSAPQVEEAPAVIAPIDLSVVDMNDELHDLNWVAEGGTPVVLVFWQTWCVSCRQEAPGLIRATRKYDGKLAFFGVVSGPDDVVDDAEVRRIARLQKSPWPQLRDRDLRLTKHFEVDGTPTIIVLGKGGKVLYRGHEAPPSWDALLL